MGVSVITDFVHESFGSRVIFAPKARHRVPDEARRLSAERVLVISSPAMKPHADVLFESLGSAGLVRIDNVTPHVPAEMAKDAAAAAGNAAADLMVCIGGGSSIGLAKAVALGTGLPILAIPTTYSGSEMTPIWGLTEGGRKTTGRDARVQPRVVVYDPELTLTLPASVSAASMMNAVAHCVEGLYAADASPVTRLLAAEGIQALAASLPRVVERPDDLPARSAALYGAWIAGSTLGTVRMGVHHTICHVLGGTFGLPHAGTHSAVLPHAVSYNALAAPEAMTTLARCLSTDDPAGALWDLAASSGAPSALADFEFHRADAATAAAMVIEANPVNPRHVVKEEIEQLLLNAHDGMRPTDPGGGQP